jgi:hypothetical protein
MGKMEQEAALGVLKLMKAARFAFNRDPLEMLYRLLI